VDCNPVLQSRVAVQVMLLEQRHRCNDARPQP
jgi:hypothetical protein